MEKFMMILLVFFTIGCFASFFLTKLVKSRKWCIHIPEGISVLIIGYLIFKVKFGNLEGFEGLGYLILVFIVGAFFVGNLSANLIFSLMKKREDKILKDLGKTKVDETDGEE